MTPASLAALAQTITPSSASVSQFWPTTVVGWITVVGFVVSMLAAVFSGGKLWGKIVGIETTIAQQFRAQDEKFGNLLAQHERDVRSSLNGLGGRVSTIEDSERHREGMFDAFRQFMATATLHQQHLEEKLDGMQREMQEMRKDASARDRAVLDAITKLRRDA